MERSPSLPAGEVGSARRRRSRSRRRVLPQSIGGRRAHPFAGRWAHEIEGFGGQAPGGADPCHRPCIGQKNIFAKTKERFRRLDVCSTSGSARPPADRGNAVRAKAVIDTKYRHVPVHAAGVSDDEGSDPRGGRIINNGSISAHAPRANSAPTPRKHAITGSPNPPRSMAASTTSPAARSTSAMR